MVIDRLYCGVGHRINKDDEHNYAEYDKAGNCVPLLFDETIEIVSHLCVRGVCVSVCK